MSVYYQFVGKDREYFDLSSGGWYSYYESLGEVLNGKIRAKKSYKEFVNALKGKKVFEGFYDDDEEFITQDCEKYFLKPLFDWAYKQDGVQLVTDDELFDLAVMAMCEEKGLKYEWFGWNYSEEIEEQIKHYVEEEDGVVRAYFKCVGKLYPDDQVYSDIGVSFEHALAEMKNGATIWQKSNSDVQYFMRDSLMRVVWKGHDAECGGMSSLQILAEDWQYVY